MKHSVAWVVLGALTAAMLAVLWRSPAEGPDEDAYILPDDLLIGAGTSASQTEGAAYEDGKWESAYDLIVQAQRKQTVVPWDNKTYEAGVDSYHRYKDDVAMAAKLKLQVYRISISWARIFPTGDATKPNLKAVQFYHNLIDEILSYNIIPLVTLYHFDHPADFDREFLGWQNEKMIGKFREYCAFIFKQYGHKVKMWTSVNEPDVYCSFFNNLNVKYGLRQLHEADPYICMYHSVLGHAAAREALVESGHQGTIGISVSSAIAQPNSTSVEDAYASEAFNQFATGIVLHPVIYGDYPPIVKEILGRRLPAFTDKEKASLFNSTDYIGVNLYFSLVASYRHSGTPKKPVRLLMSKALDDLGFVNVGYLDSHGRSLKYFVENEIVPGAVRSNLAYFWLRYKKPIIITENGYLDMSKLGVRDRPRAVYFSSYLRTMLSAMKEFGVRVIAFCAWSLIDSWEWSKRFDKTYGLVYVDVKGGTYDRSLKDSSAFWIELAERRAVPVVHP